MARRGGRWSRRSPDSVGIENGQEVVDYIHCVHCSKIWAVTPGLGKKFGWCSGCNGFYCGPRCKDCTPFEKRLDLYEVGKLKNLMP